MAKTTKDEMLAIVDGLIQQGLSIDRDTVNYAQLDTGQFSQWIAEIAYLVKMLGPLAGPLAEPRSKVFSHNDYWQECVVGQLRALRSVIDRGLLLKVEDLVLAETFADLLEQANHLVAHVYELAAGVLGRAVLEEHLRKLCERHQCTPAGRPTLNALNDALYRGQHLDRIAMQHVTALAAIGNHCAHNEQPPRDRGEIERFLRDVRGFLVQYPM